MTDEEMTQLCAEAMGIPLEPGMEGGYFDGDGSLRTYGPLHNDAQAMALMKRFGGSYRSYKHGWEVRLEEFDIRYTGHDLNRCIVTAVAMMRAPLKDSGDKHGTAADLEMMRLCAEAIGFESDQLKYDPLRRDWQAMELVRDLKLRLSYDDEYHQWNCSSPHNEARACEIDLNRAIVHCVARMQREVMASCADSSAYADASLPLPAPPSRRYAS